MKRNALVSLKILLAILCGFSAQVVRAGQAPDIVWATNAHNYAVTGIGFSGDSMAISSASLDRSVRVWNVTNAALVRNFTISGGAPLSVALSQDGALVAAGDGSGTTRVWRMSDGVRLWIGGPDDAQAYSVCFSPDDSLLGISRSDGINVRYAQTGGGIVFGEPQGDVFGIRFSPDGNSLASANQDQNASLWSVPAGTLIRDFIGHSNQVNSVDFSPDAILLATASTDGTARIWNVTNGAVLRVMEGGGGIAKFSTDGSLLLTLKDGTFKIWRVFSGTCVGSITNSGATTFDIAKNGKYFAYGTESGAVVLARMPLIMSEIRRQETLVGLVPVPFILLKWQGGSGLYQVQSRTNPATGPWQNVGTPTTNTSFSNILSGGNLFYRVQSVTLP